VRSDSIEATILRGARDRWEPLGPAAFDDELFVRHTEPPVPAAP
jgi:hypothetical protein